MQSKFGDFMIIAFLLLVNSQFLLLAHWKHRMRILLR